MIMKTTVSKTTTKFEIRYPVKGGLSMRHAICDDKAAAVKSAKYLCKNANMVYYVKRIDSRVVHISRPPKTKK